MKQRSGPRAAPQPTPPPTVAETPVGPQNLWKGLAPTVLEAAGVTVERGLVRLPYRRPDGSEQNAKLFRRDGRSWWEHAGRELIPYGLETLPGRPSFAAICGLFVAEGESDALALREAFRQSASDSVVHWFAIALPGAGTWRRSWRRYIAAFPLVYIVGDGDMAGRGMNAKIKRDVPWSRPVWLPDGTDARGLLQVQGVPTFEALLDQADRDAQLAAAFVLARDLERFEVLLGSEEVRRP